MRSIRLILTYLIFPWIGPFLFMHPKLREGFWERFGLNTAAVPGSGPRVWLHGASAGDVLALVPTAKALRHTYPSATIIISAMTNSGYAMAWQQKSVFDQIRYFPWDLPGAIKRTLRVINPDIIVFEYAELWPELIHQASQKHIPLVLHNGRFSRERFERYRRLFRITGNLVQQLSLLLVRDEAEKKRAVALGTAPQTIQITGNTKFDHLTSPPEQTLLDTFTKQIHLNNIDEAILVGGSTHDGEEETLLKSLASLRNTNPKLRLILAPRYIERSVRLRDLAQRHGFQASLRTKPTGPWDVLILDTVGELSVAYAISTLVFVGGSLNDRGGHNIVEPALCSKPVIFGPYMSNVEDSVQLLLGRGGLQVSGPDQLERVLDELLSDSTKREQLGKKAALQARSVQGAAQKNAEHIKELLTQRHAPT